MTTERDTSMTCPSCHTARPGVTNETWDAGGQWRCERCGERWTRTRLATVAEYEAWERTNAATGITKRVVVGAALLGLALSASASAQDVSKYRDYALGSPLESVIVATRTHAEDVRIVHERPARIQELQFRAPYQSDAAGAADPMRSILFSFLDGQLYRLVVTYDRDRTEGLSDADIVGALSDAYGVPSRGLTPTRVDGPSGTFSAMTAVALWETDASRLTLVRDKYVRDFQLVFTSRALESRAAAAAREAVRLDAAEAPRREVEERKKATADAAAAREKTRSTNKRSFRP